MNLLIEAARATSSGGFGVCLLPHGYTPGDAVGTEGSMQKKDWLDWIHLDIPNDNLGNIVWDPGNGATPYGLNFT